MGIFSKTCEYGIRAVFFIAQRSQENKRVGIKEIAENIHSPEAFLGGLNFVPNSILAPYTTSSRPYAITFRKCFKKRPLANSMMSLLTEKFY